MKNKKLVLSLGSALLVFAPVMAVVACGDDSKPAETDQQKADAAIAKVTTLALGDITMAGATPTNAELTTAIKAKNTGIDAAVTFEAVASPAVSATGATVKAKVGSTLSTATKAVTFAKLSADQTAINSYAAAITAVAPATGLKTIADLDGIVANSTTTPAVINPALTTGAGSAAALATMLGFTSITLPTTPALPTGATIEGRLTVDGTPVAGSPKTYKLTITVAKTGLTSATKELTGLKSSDNYTAPATTTAADQLALAEAYFATAPDLATTVTTSELAKTALLALITTKHESYTYSIPSIDMGTKLFSINVVNKTNATDTATTATAAKKSFTANQYDVNAIKTTMITPEKLGAEGAWTSTMTETQWNAIEATTADQVLTAAYITNTLLVADKTLPSLDGETLKYAITKDAAQLTFTVKIAKGTGATAGAATAVYTIAKPGAPAFTQENLNTYVNTTITYTAPTGAAANIATLTPLVTTAETTLTQALATPLGIALDTTPSGVTVKYTFTKGDETPGSAVTFTLTIKGEYSGLNAVTRTETITSSDTVAPAGTDQTALNTYMTTTLAATPADTPNKEIADLELIVTATATAVTFDNDALTTLGITAAGLATKPADVTLTYQLVKGAAVEAGNPQTYTLTITGTVSGTTDLTATKTLTITSSDNVA